MNQPKPTLVLLHGWAVHSEIWHSITAELAKRFQLLPIDLPGYGTRCVEDGDLDLYQLTRGVLDQAPTDAHWLGWSMGAMIAMQAAIEDPERIASLTLISPTPKFMQGADWPHGTTEPALDNLRNRFQQNYDVALKRFLLLQAGMNKDARDNARRTYDRLLQHPAPTSATLEAGLKILQQTDLRQIADQIKVPTHIVTCAEDRVIPPTAGAALHHLIPRSKLTSLPTGHAPMIESPESFIAAIDPQDLL